MLEFYRTQGAMSDPGDYLDLYQGLGNDIEELVAAVQGVMIHAGLAAHYGVKDMEEEKRVYDVRLVQDILRKIKALEAAPLSIRREPANRVIGNCRTLAVLLTSILRYKGIPARSRSGFESYLLSKESGIHHNHWICEYWHSTAGRWVQVDPQIDEMQRKVRGVSVNTLDLPSGAFLAGGEVWRSCSERKESPDRFGVRVDEGWAVGWGFVRSTLVCDLMALNKLEVLPWDCNDLWGKDKEKLNDAEYALLDKVARLTTAGSSAFTELRDLYESDSSLRMPADWKP